MNLQTLYKKTKTGKTQICEIAIADNTIITRWGQLEGKLQEKTDKITGVNIGRANETSGGEQAVLEAKAKWAKKVKGGYSTDKSAPVTVQLAQKVKSYQDNKKKILAGAYSTIKYNGINGIFWLEADNSIKLTSRGGEVYPAIPHLEEAVREIMSEVGVTCFNCELYIHGEHLQDINSAVKKTKALSKQLTFKVFEFPLMAVPYKDKVQILEGLEHGVNPTKVENAQEIEQCYEDAMAGGYEGTVLYNAKALYKFNQRSSDVYKYKKVKDREFKVLSYDLDKHDHAVYVCMAENGKPFGVKRKGTAPERLADALTASSNIGLWLNVEYEMLSRGGTPLKGVGNHFRRCNDKGEPLE